MPVMTIPSSDVTSRSPIPIPMKQRWRHARIQWLPIVVFSVAIIASMMLLGRRASIPFSVGQVNVAAYSATSTSSGTLVDHGDGTTIEPFQSVRAGEVLARLDDRPVRASIATMQGELARVRLDVAAAEASWEASHGRLEVDAETEWHRRTLQVELLRLDILDRKTRLELDRVSLVHEESILSRAEAAHQGDVMNDLELDRIRVLRDVIVERIEQNTFAIEESQRQLELAMVRLEQFDRPGDEGLLDIIAPLQAAVLTQELRIGELQLQVEGLEILAPISGVITVVHHVPGQTVQVGEPIVTIASPEGTHIVAYVRQRNDIQPQVGMRVSVQLRSHPGERFDSIIERVGPGYEPVPLSQLRDPATPEWGLPVRITLRRDVDLKPGELVDLRFHLEPGA